ncbi:hypothetical protein FGO68_gene8646 [Halteria grandinella]|uniref:Uncharacterized protein n=1 Tax=Halteria grandinella TaxID=5974 RepID=A0A8J8T575_HALGN|nr:hypothetical protein FGO68_gene8646 [Halteria grandinella]
MIKAKKRSSYIESDSINLSEESGLVSQNRGKQQNERNSGKNAKNNEQTNGPNATKQVHHQLLQPNKLAPSRNGSSQKNNPANKKQSLQDFFERQAEIKRKNKRLGFVAKNSYVSLMDQKMNVEEVAEMMEDEHERRIDQALLDLGYKIDKVSKSKLPPKPVIKTKVQSNPGGLPPVRASLLKMKVPFKQMQCEQQQKAQAMSLQIRIIKALLKLKGPQNGKEMTLQTFFKDDRFMTYYNPPQKEARNSLSPTHSKISATSPLYEIKWNETLELNLEAQDPKNIEDPIIFRLQERDWTQNLRYIGYSVTDFAELAIFRGVSQWISIMDIDGNKLGEVLIQSKLRYCEGVQNVCEQQQQQISPSQKTLGVGRIGEQKSIIKQEDSSDHRRNPFSLEGDNRHNSAFNFMPQALDLSQHTRFSSGSIMNTHNHNSSGVLDLRPSDHFKSSLISPPPPLKLQPLPNGLFSNGSSSGTPSVSKGFFNQHATSSPNLQSKLVRSPESRYQIDQQALFSFQGSENRRLTTDQPIKRIYPQQIPMKKGGRGVSLGGGEKILKSILK